MTRNYKAFVLGLVIAFGVMLSACSTTGNNFSSQAANQLVPGQTTLEQASIILQGEPTNVYRQLDGSATAYWSHKASFVPDAIYFNRELILYFDSDGYFQRIVGGRNMPENTGSAQQPQVQQPQVQQPAAQAKAKNTNSNQLELDDSNSTVQRYKIN